MPFPHSHHPTHSSCGSSLFLCASRTTQPGLEEVLAASVSSRVRQLLGQKGGLDRTSPQQQKHWLRCAREKKGSPQACCVVSEGPPQPSLPIPAAALVSNPNPSGKTHSWALQGRGRPGQTLPPFPPLLNGPQDCTCSSLIHEQCQ